MEQRDFLKLQIEQQGRALGQLFARFLGLKSQGNAEEAIEITNESLRTEFNVDIDQLLSLSPSDLNDYLTQRKLTGESLMPLADYLMALAEISWPTQQSRAVVMYRRVLLLYAIMDASADSYSLSRFEKEQHINESFGDLPTLAKNRSFP